MNRREKARVALIGAGALGTFFGWHLALSTDVTVLDSNLELVDLIRARGLTIEGEEARPVRATEDAAEVYNCDALFVFVKATDTLAALRPFAGKLDPATTVVSLQNGIGNEQAIKTALGGNVPLVIGATSEAAFSVGPGLSRRMGGGTTVLGSAGATAPTVERVAEWFTRGGLVARSVYDIRPHLWGKLLANAAINPVCTLLDRDSSVILEDENAAALARTIAEEVAAVASAMRIKLPFVDEWTYVREVAAQTAHVRNSMSIDLSVGRPTEIEQINGAVVGAGRRLGVPAPANEAVMRLIRARQALG